MDLSLSCWGSKVPHNHIINYLPFTKMSDDQNIPAEQTTDDSQQTTGKNTQALGESQPSEKSTDNSPQTTEENTQPLSESQLQTTNYKPQTENMEVNHPHHVTHKKKWGEYLLEFLMLFLAVFLGFVAENIREHRVEKNRERQYIGSLIADLNKDQQVLSQNIKSVKEGILMMDTLISMLNHPLQLADHTGQVYYLARLAPRLNPLSTNDRTFEQLKNSGNFRLIRDISISNKIMNYYENFPLIRLLESINETEFTEYKKAAAKIFNPAVFVSMEGNYDQIIRTTENPSLRTMNNETLQELSVFAVYMHGTKKGILGAEEKLKIAGAELIEYLREEYDLRKE